MPDLFVKLQPGASADRIEGWEAGADGRPVLKVRVRARPVEGQANDALIRLIADALGLPRGQVALIRGDRSRLKRLSVSGLGEDEMKRRLGGSPIGD